MVLSTLPIPPVPVYASISGEGIEFSDIQQVFDIATCEIRKSAQSEDKVVNSHALIASMMLFRKWTKFGNNPDTQEDIKAGQEKIILELMQDVISFEESRVGCADSSTDVYKIFFDANVKWIKNYQPAGAVIDITPVTIEKIHNEHNVHVAISHYSYSQGILYSDKCSELKCMVHDNLHQQYTRMVKTAGEDPDSDESLRLDKQNVREECMEVAELYSQFNYEKLLFLAYTRILQVYVKSHFH